MKLNIELNKSVGPFKLGESIDEYVSEYENVFIPGSEDESWDGYSFLNDWIEVYFDKETKIIESIACRKECYWNQENLIGMPITEFFQLANIEKSDYVVESIELVDEDQDVYDFESVNLQLWVNADQKIVTVFIHGDE